METSADEQDTQVGAQAETQEHADEQTTGGGSVGKFDPADVCKNISIDGRIVEFPWTLNKLGDEYEYSDIFTGDSNDNISGAYLIKNGERFLIVNVGDEVVDRDSPIVVMRFSITDNISIYSLGAGTTKEDVIRLLGQPAEVRDDQVLDCHYVYISNEMLLEFSFYEGKLVDTHINVYGDWK